MHWTQEQTDSHEDEFIEELLLSMNGWDEAVAEVQRRESRRNAPKPSRPTLYGAGMGG